MKYLTLVLFLTQSLSVLADDGDLTHFIESGDFVAAVSWDHKTTCLPPLSTLIGIPVIDNCPDADGTKFYSPTVLIFYKETGAILKAITFFNEECPYEPVALSVNGNELTMTVKILAGGDVLTAGGPSKYPYDNCQYSDQDTTIRETRNAGTGELIKQVALQDHRSFDFP
jgi:hypothetical protein